MSSWRSEIGFHINKFLVESPPVKLPSGNKQLNDQSRNKQLDDQSRNKQLDDQSRNKQLNDPSRNKQLDNQSRNKQLDDQLCQGCTYICKPGV